MNIKDLESRLDLPIIKLYYCIIDSYVFRDSNNYHKCNLSILKDYSLEDIMFFDENNVLTLRDAILSTEFGKPNIQKIQQYLIRQNLFNHKAITLLFALLHNTPKARKILVFWAHNLLIQQSSLEQLQSTIQRSNNEH